MKKISAVIFFGVLLTALPMSGCAEGAEGTIEVRSTAFAEGDRIPSDFTCEGADMSPPIEWANIPSGTKSIAIFVEDPDAPSGNWSHWLAYDLPPSMRQLPPGIPASQGLPAGGIQGRTDFGNAGYSGPCPPQGTHRYFFRVYALDTLLGLKPGATKQELLRAMQGHILAQGQLMGTYDRS
jgi:Raf kinase inhibitor-like YbhB/YbcL family protein